MRGPSTSPYTGEPPPIFAQAAGVPVVYAAATQPSPRSVAILTEAGSDGEISRRSSRQDAWPSPKDRARTTCSLRPSEHAGLRYSDIQPVYLQPADGRTALQSGSVDAWSIWDPFLAAAQVAGATILDRRHRADAQPRLLSVEPAVRDAECGRPSPRPSPP